MGRVSWAALAQPLELVREGYWTVGQAWRRETDIAANNHDHWEDVRLHSHMRVVSASPPTARNVDAGNTHILPCLAQRAKAARRRRTSRESTPSHEF